MVAEMASLGSSCCLEEGDGHIPEPDQKGHLAESDQSGSETAGTITEESSEEEEQEEEQEEGQEEEEDSDPASSPAASRPAASRPAASSPAASSREDVIFKSCCEKCKAIQQSPGGERVTPRMLARGQMQLQLEDEGVFQCSVTGLVFEVSEKVLLRYSILSWSKFGKFLTDAWSCAGPIFNVDCVNKDSTVLKSIQFPHTLCLADPDSQVSFRVLHLKAGRPLMEPCVDHSGSHVKWCVSSLSPVGPVAQASPAQRHHAVVLLYRERGLKAHCFRVYLAPNNSSDIKDIGKEVRSSNRKFQKVDKPPTCSLDERTYRLLTEPEGEITPEELSFTLAVTKLKGYFEVFFDHSPPFKLSLMETESDQTIWSTYIREEDCVDPVEPQKKQTISRKRSSTSEEEITNKRSRWTDESGGCIMARAPRPEVTDKQLLQVARRLGKEWRQVGIFLGLKSRDLDELQAGEKDVTMQKFKMLEEWRRQQGQQGQQGQQEQQGHASLEKLKSSLEELDDLAPEVLLTLQEMMDNQADK
ncbi:uncharacterized protein si:dkeyp-97b10.3 isoform X2 [Osmerus mordax]|uniref:uncharacterized protein si:dkeyp-97b10.3 isoform X2 n=1 Tax=Osmerus mordax TaxID=8014 RepID=UPI00350E99B2